MTAPIFDDPKVQDFGRDLVRGRFLDTGGHVFNAKAFGAVGDGVTDDTAAVEAANAAIAISGGRLYFPPGTYLVDSILVRSGVWYDFGRATIAKRVDGTSVSTNSLIRAVETLVGATYYGTYADIKLTGGYLDPNGKTCPANLVRLLYVDRLTVSGVNVVDIPTGQWAFALGGRNGLIENCTIRGGSAVGEDGIHLVHGQYWRINGNDIESGDDAIAIGPTSDTFVDADPDPIRYVTGGANTVNSAKAHGLRVYVASGNTGTSREVTDIAFDGLVGMAGVTRNGGILIDDNNDGAYGTTQIRRVRVEGVQLKVGSTGHDDVNPFGVRILSAFDVRVAGTIQMTDATGAAAGFRLANVAKSDVVRLDLNCPALQKNGGVSVTSSRGVRLSGTITGSATQAQSSVILVDAEQTILDATLTDVPSGISVVAINSGTLTALDLGRSVLGHASGASAGVGLATTAALFTHIRAVGVDFSLCFSPFAATSIPSGTSFEFAQNQGAQTRVTGQATITAGGTSVVVTHGAALNTASLSQVSVTPDSGWGNATTWWIGAITGTTFTINVNIAPGGAGMTFRWIVDAGRKPI